MSTAQRLKSIQEAIVRACERVGRDPAEITLVGVSKNVTSEAVAIAIEHGLQTFGENRVQEAALKTQVLQSISPKPKWHLIGHLQSNKAKKAVALFDVIQSVDTHYLAEALQKHAANSNYVIDVMAQVNTSGESTKHGVAPDQALNLIREMVTFPNIRLVGLMTIGAFVDDIKIIRKCFRTLRELASETTALNLPKLKLQHLSMGMTNDFEIAIEEGATVIRVGRALFGSRPIH